MRKCSIGIIVSVLMILSGCDDLVNSMDSKKMSVEDTATAVNDLIEMGLNSDNSVYKITFNNEDQEVYIEAVFGLTCVSMESGLSFPYGDTDWSASFVLKMDGCEGDSGSLYDGSITISLSGPIGSVTSFGYSGSLTLTGAIEGTVSLDFHYDWSMDCAINWDDCWGGTVNGYTIAELYKAYTN